MFSILGCVFGTMCLKEQPKAAVILILQCVCVVYQSCVRVVNLKKKKKTYPIQSAWDLYFFLPWYQKRCQVTPSFFIEVYNSGIFTTFLFQMNRTMRCLWVPSRQESQQVWVWAFRLYPGCDWIVRITDLFHQLHLDLRMSLCALVTVW